MNFTKHLAQTRIKSNHSKIGSYLLIILILFISRSAIGQIHEDVNGNVGLGTNNPSQKLDIEGGNIIVGNNFGLIFKNSAGANDGTKVYRRTGNALGLSYRGNFLRFDALNDDPVIFNNSIDETKVQIHPAGNSWFKSGNVGIGTSNPSRKLHVFGEVRVQKNIGQITSGNHWQTGNHTLELYGTGGSDLVLSFHRAGLNSGVIKFAEKDGVTGLTLSANDAVNTNQLFLKRDGKIGIGTTAPQATLDVAGNTAVYDDFIGYSGVSDGTLPNGKTTTLIIKENTSGTKSPHGATYKGGLSFGVGGAGIYSVNPNPHGSDHYGDLRFHTTYWNGSGFRNADRMVIQHKTGNVGIGTINPDHKLSVNGMITSEELLLTDVDGADFVFEEDYDLRSLEETEQFIKANKHLPEIPSAAEMAEEGLEIKVMNIKLLQKVEELTLHLIRMEKEIQELKAAQNK